MPDNEPVVVSESQTQQTAAPVEAQQTQQPSVPADVARNMAIALNNGIIPDEYRGQSVNTATTENTTDTNNATTDTNVVQSTDVIVPPSFTFETFTQKFGYQTPEDAIKEIEELRGFKANPTKEELKFANDEAKRIYEYLNSGKEDEVLNTLAKRKMVRDIDTQTDEQKLKTYIKLQNPLFDDELIEDEYKQLYTVDENKFKNDLDEIDALAFKKEKIRTQQRVMNELEKANEFFSTYKNKIELQPLPTDIDPDYIEYKKMQDATKRLDEEAVVAYQKITPKELAASINFNDEASKVAFQYQFEPDTESFKQVIEYATNAEKFFNLFANPDGSPNAAKWARFLYNGFNAEKMVTEGIKQGSNARMKSLVPDNSGSNGNGVVRQMPVMPPLEPSELDKRMQAAGIKKVNNF